jgi:hypothetical protein
MLIEELGDLNQAMRNQNNPVVNIMRVCSRSRSNLVLVTLGYCNIRMG